jgi:CelD/BcsL family acetyltransferase involved in cellulose biosynthesis
MPATRVEIVTRESAAAHVAAWRDLCARALEANVFAEPAFVLSALQNFVGGDRLRLLFVWRGEDERLIGVLVLQHPRGPFGFGVARVWQSNQAGLGALVLDREGAEIALGAVMDWIARERSTWIGLLLPTLDAAGPTAAAVRAVGAQRNAAFRTSHARSRAVLSAASKLARGFEASLPKKRLKEWGRQMRRLKERGEVAYRIVADANAVEKFLTLEAKGWKGVQHTALGHNAGLAAFTRSMLSSLATEGRLAIPILELGGEPVAIGVVLRSNDRAFFWKTAYDEAYAEYSPGVLLTLELSRAQQRDTAVVMTDSCAIEGHSMIERLWPARMTLVDCVLATRSGNARLLGLWLASEAAKLRLKEIAKRAINPLRGRKRS